MIKVGETIPSIPIRQVTNSGPREVNAYDIFAGKRSILFAVPGAFTPVCSTKHLPGFLTYAPALQQKSIQQIACLAVNDAFVLQAWAEDLQVYNKILMLADGNASLTKAMGLTLDLTNFGMGIRSQRYTMVIQDGIIEHLEIEPAGTCHLTSAEHILEKL